MRSPSPVLPSFVVIVIVFVVAKSSRFRFFPNDDSIDEDIEKRASIIERKRNTNVQHRAKQSTLIALLLLLMMMSIASLALLPKGGPLNEIVTQKVLGEKSSLREARACFRAFRDGHILGKSPTLTSSAGENGPLLRLR